MQRAAIQQPAAALQRPATKQYTAAQQRDAARQPAAIQYPAAVQKPAPAQQPFATDVLQAVSSYVISGVAHGRKLQLSHVMRLWYFSSSKPTLLTSMRIHPVGLIFVFGRTLGLLLYLMCANSESSGETARLLVTYVISTFFTWAAHFWFVRHKKRVFITPMPSHSTGN